MEAVQSPTPKTPLESARSMLRAEFEDIAKLLQVYQYSDDERFTKVHEHAFAMKSKQPQMSNERVVRKTVEYFKLKKQEENGSN